MTLSCCEKNTGKSGCAFTGGGCYPNTEADGPCVALQGYDEQGVVPWLG